MEQTTNTTRKLKSDLGSRVFKLSEHSQNNGTNLWNKAQSKPNLTKNKRVKVCWCKVNQPKLKNKRVKVCVTQCKPLHITQLPLTTP